MAQRLRTLLSPKYRPVLIYGLLSLLILGPLLKPGYILTLDMVFVPRIGFPDHISSAFLLKALLSLLNLVLPSYVIQKLLLLITFTLMGLGMHRLSRQLDSNEWGAYIAGAFYVINPYTYSRFMAGQYLVLLGYALVPFFAVALLRFLKKPGWDTTIRLVAWATAISIVSIHTLGLILVMVVVGLLLSLKYCRKNIRAVVKYSLLGTAAFILVSCYWLIPSALGGSDTAQTVARFNAGDTHTFATIGGGVIGQISNIVRLQGFWLEARGFYRLPQDSMPAWGLLALAVWVFVAIGGVALWRKGRRLEVALLGLSASLALIMSVGDTSSWLARIPLAAGYREPHKFVGLIALMYAAFAGQGVNGLAKKYQKKFGDIGTYCVLACAILLVVCFTPNMSWGFGGQLHATHYPKDWSQANELLNKDQSNFRVLSLPWHLYMNFGFAGRIISNPAEDFFDKPFIVNNDPEFGKASRTSSDPLKHRLDEEILPDAPKHNSLGTKLLPLNVKYVVLFKEADKNNYNYLDRQKGLKLLKESATLKIYRNEVFGR